MTTTEDLAREAGFAGDELGAPLLRIFESFRSLVESNAYRKGQEDMQRRAIDAIPINATPMEACGAIRALPIEEPK